MPDESWIFLLAMGYNAAWSRCGISGVKVGQLPLILPEAQTPKAKPETKPVIIKCDWGFGVDFVFDIYKYEVSRELRVLPPLGCRIPKPSTSSTPF